MASDPPAKKALTISWDQFHRDARALAALLRAAGPFSCLVAITRGGLTPAAIVARELDLRCIETISVASYLAETVQGEGRIIKEIAPAFIAAAEGSKVLVIDDLADTGETLKLVRRIPALGACGDALCQAHRKAAGRYIRDGSAAGYLDLFSLGSRLELRAAAGGRSLKIIAGSYLGWRHTNRRSPSALPPIPSWPSSRGPAAW